MYIGLMYICLKLLKCQYEIFHIAINFTTMNQTSKTLYDCDQCVFRSLSCLMVPVADFDELASKSVQIRYQKGETIFRQGGKSGGLLFLHAGIVKFTYTYDTGKTYIMTVTKGPRLLGGANLFFQATNIFSIVAVEDCDVCLIDFESLQKLVMKHPAYFMGLCESSVQMFQHSIFNFISLAHNQVIGRIASILIYLWDHVYRDSNYEFNMSRKELSEFAACAHENVIHTLSRFRKDGVLRLEGRKIEILKYDLLLEISKKG